MEEDEVIWTLTITSVGRDPAVVREIMQSVRGLSPEEASRQLDLLTQGFSYTIPLTDQATVKELVARIERAGGSTKCKAKGRGWSTERPLPPPASKPAPSSAGQIRCPHCESVGTVRTKSVKVKRGISGGKATGAILTGGWSVLATGLSRKERTTEAHCTACGVTWHI